MSVFFSPCVNVIGPAEALHISTNKIEPGRNYWVGKPSNSDTEKYLEPSRRNTAFYGRFSSQIQNSQKKGGIVLAAIGLSVGSCFIVQNELNFSE